MLKNMGPKLHPTPSFGRKQLHMPKRLRKVFEKHLVITRMLLLHQLLRRTNPPERKIQGGGFLIRTKMQVSAFYLQVKLGPKYGPNLLRRHIIHILPMPLLQLDNPQLQKMQDQQPCQQWTQTWRTSVTEHPLYNRHHQNHQPISTRKMEPKHLASSIS